MSIQSGRLTRLEDRMPKGCATCQDWTVEVLRFQIGDEPAESTRPDACPNCGREAPLSVHLIRITERPDGPA